MTRPYNFSAGPATLPESVLIQAQNEMLNWNGSGMSVMEMTHRGSEFQSIHHQALQDLRDLLQVPSDYDILLMHGGGQGQNSIIPFNLLGDKKQLDFVISGHWSRLASIQAQAYAQVNVIANSEVNGYTALPDWVQVKVNTDSAYVHVCTNETIHGIEFADVPANLKTPVPVVADMSSHLLSRAIRLDDYGLIYACAQKNLGIAGMTIVILNRKLLGKASPLCPKIFNYTEMVKENSMVNTPATYSIYMAGLVFQWLKKMGGVAAIEKVNIEKARLLYDTIDNSYFYGSKIEKRSRSRMNIPFTLPTPELEAQFLQESKAAGLLNLKGHKAVGGMRASIYNAMPLEGVQALVHFMREFEHQHQLK